MFHVVQSTLKDVKNNPNWQIYDFHTLILSLDETETNWS